MASLWVTLAAVFFAARTHLETIATGSVHIIFNFITYVQ